MQKIFYVIPAIVAAVIVAAYVKIHEWPPQLPNPGIETSNLINGKEPPNTPTMSMSEVRVLDVEVGDNQIITSRTTRKFGTRSPIHIHPYGGQTCVLTGEMTLYMDGAEPLVAKAGDCYWMPPKRRMTGVNTSKTDTVMLDSFVVPKGTQVWLVVEPGQEDAQEQFDKLFHSH